MMEKNCRGFNCPVEATIQLIGGKYKAVILWHLMNNTLRYSEIHKLIPKATDKMLAQQLRELEKDGLINRKVYPVVPPKTEYSLTEFGKTSFTAEISNKIYALRFLYPRKLVIPFDFGKSHYVDEITHVAIVNGEGFEYVPYEVEKFENGILPVKKPENK